VTTSPLKGLRVLEVSSVVMGPFSAQLLADMGADVIKLESLDGDVLRYSGPSKTAGLSSSFSLLNRNKRSIAIDLKHPRASGLLAALIKSVDVLVHNIRSGPAKKLGLDYDSVYSLNEKIIHVHLTGFDSDGPYAENPAYEDIIQSVSGAAGLSAMIGEGNKPSLIPTLIADKVTGLHAMGTVLAAAYHREKNGEGTRIEVPMFETVASFLEIEHFGSGMWSGDARASGYGRILNDRMRPFKTRDGYIGLLPYADRDWHNLFLAIDRPDMVDDPRLVNHNSRVQHLCDLYDLIHEATPAKTSEEWLAIFQEAGVPASRFNTLATLPDDPHIQEVGFFVKRESDNQGTYTDIRPPYKFDGQVPGLRYEPPTLGQHSREILTEVGLDAREIETLVEENVILSG